jgi:hypothetical protein
MQKALRERSQSHRNQSGAVALMVALMVTGLVIVGGLVVDIGLMRLDRQMNKSAADSAAISSLEAMRHVDALGNETGKAAPYPAVCAALDYLQSSRPEFAGVTGQLENGMGAVVGNCPLPLASPLTYIACEPDDRSTWARYEGTADGGRLRVEIMNGYVASEDTARFEEENLSTLVADQGAPEHKGCDQLAVIVTETESPTLGRVASTSDMTTTIRSVARVDMGDDNSEAVALVTLEREDCKVLYSNGGTTLIVDGYDAVPGMIHLDSLGKAGGADCGSKKVVHVDGSTIGAVVAGDSADGQPGVIGMVALNGGAEAVAANAFSPIPHVYTEPYPPGGEPTGHKLITRSPADDAYFTGVKAAISLANSLWAAPPADAVVPSTSCSGNNVPNAAAKSETGTVYFNCPGGVDYSQDVILAASRVIFAGDLKVRSGNKFEMPNASHVYIRGRTGVSALDNKGFFRMHTQGAATCAGSTPSVRGRLVMGTGEYNSQAGSPLFQVCNTAVIMMGGQADGCVPADAGLEPQDTTSCSSGYLNLAGGTSTDWTAPNLVEAGRTDADLEDLEDLAFWTESENESRIRGSGGITLAGVFVLPNANPFSIGGSGGQDVEDAQYFTRKLHAYGGGTLYMKPNPYNVIKTPYYGSYKLVR